MELTKDGRNFPEIHCYFYVTIAILIIPTFYFSDFV